MHKSKQQDGGRELLGVVELAADADMVRRCTDRMCRALARQEVLDAMVEAERALARLRPLLARLRMAADVSTVRKGGVA